MNESHGSAKLSTSSTWSKSPTHLIKLTKLYTYLLSLIIFDAACYILSAWIVCGGFSETAWSERQIWSETSLTAAETLVCWSVKLTSSKLLLPIAKKADYKKAIANRWTMSRWSFTVCMAAGSCGVRPARRILPHFLLDLNLTCFKGPF